MKPTNSLSTPRSQGDIDPSFASNGVFPVEIDGYGRLKTSELDTVRALDRAPDGGLVLALGCTHLETSVRGYALMRLTDQGALDPSFGGGGFVIGSTPPEHELLGAQPWIAPDRKTVVVLRDSSSRSWTLARHDVDGRLDTAFGTLGYIDLDAIRPAGEPTVVKGFVIPGPGHAFYFVGTTRETMADAERFAGGIVFRFDASGRLDPAFAGKGYAHVHVPLNPSGRVTDAVAQGDGKVVLSTATSSGNARVVRVLPTGEPDPGFGTNGVFVVEGPSQNRYEIEKLAWSADAGLWALGMVVSQSGRGGVLIALNDEGDIPASFNGGRLLEMSHGGEPDAGDGFAIPLYVEIATGRGVITVGSPYHLGAREPKRMIVARHLPSGSLDPTFGEDDPAGTPQGFYKVELAREGFNFFHQGVRMTEEHVIVELLNGDGGRSANPDRVTVERFIASKAAVGSPVKIE